MCVRVCVCALFLGAGFRAPDNVCVCVRVRVSVCVVCVCVACAHCVCRVCDGVVCSGNANDERNREHVVLNLL